MKKEFKSNHGVTLIELLVALVISSALVAGLYRTFIGQQRTYTVQEQVIDMQQNARVGINRMMGEIRMAGFGNVSMVLPVTINSKTFNNVLNPGSPAEKILTIISSNSGPANLTAAISVGQNQIVVSTLHDSQGNLLFDIGNRRYISVGGLESFVISSINAGTKTITLSGTSTTYNYPIGTPVFGIRAMTYQITNVGGKPTLMRDENTGSGSQIQADNIDQIQFGYFDANGNQTAVLASIRMVRVSLIARTNLQDPQLQGGDGYRRREIASNIHLRNMGL